MGGLIEALTNAPLDPTAGVPQGQAWNPAQDYTDWYNRGGVSQYTGMLSPSLGVPATTQIWNNEQAYQALPPDAPLADRMKVIADSPLMMAMGVDAAPPRLLATIADNPLAAAIGVQHPPIQAYHGSPYSFDQFDLSKIGTGEGAQAYGHGLYFAGNEDVARSYRDALSRPTVGGQVANPTSPADIAAVAMTHHGDADKAIADLLDPTNAQFFTPQEVDVNQQAAELIRSGSPLPTVMPAQPGHMYEVALHTDPASLLDWDRQLSSQSQRTQAALADLGFMPNAPGQASGAAPRSGPIVLPEPTGAQMYRRLAGGDFGGKAAGAADTLNQAGIPGIQYLDAGSRAAGDGTRNYVMFDPARIQILRKYGLIPLLAGGAAAGTGQQ